MKLSDLLSLSVILLGAAGCMPGEHLSTPQPARTSTARAAHAGELDRVDRPGAEAWEHASRRALRSGLRIAPSFREKIRFPDNEAHAVAYRFALARGEVLRVTLSSQDRRKLFAEIFHDLGDDMFRPVFAPPGDAERFEYRASADGDYVLRLQPPLGGGGLFEVTVFADAALLFPVAGSGLATMGGTFGDARDGGARDHEGIDIFAPRGTPVLAVTDGRVTTVRTTPVGGRVVWIADATRELSYYYAHLEEQWVSEGSVVSAGDTVGTVGNTGNASSTRPHLHFGVYRPGTIAVDPAPLLSGSSDLMQLHARDDLLGRRARVVGDRVRLRSSPTVVGTVLAELPAATPLLVLGGIGEWHRVVLPDGTSGFIAARFTASADAAQR